MTHDEIMNLLEAEIKHAKEKHGERFSSPNEAGIALADEVVEVADAIERGDIDGEHGLKQELIDVMAVCFKALEGME